EMIPMRLMKMASGANYEAIDKNYTYKLYTKGKTAELVEGDDKAGDARQKRHGIADYLRYVD
ncbi:hypothetical protein MJM83_34680, partial [Salmonella enterica subsp. enterica serovar Montevideo]|nr:hypothetical protein [Salmonella enterica subsp. enterica serovar Montevideo]